MQDRRLTAGHRRPGTGGHAPTVRTGVGDRRRALTAGYWRWELTAGY
ncbi:MAG: hypothetical protein ACYCVB_14490 [Bacilli bacterium]